LRVVVDTGVWARFLRVKPMPGDPQVAEFRRLREEGAVVLIGPIRQEILSGAAPRERFDLLREILRAFPEVALRAEDYEQAAEFYNLCRSKGEQSTNVDLLLCAVSARHRVAIYSLDSDFVRLAKLLPITLHPPPRP
jgi:predicted nucleic acid-binding protein